MDERIIITQTVSPKNYCKYEHTMCEFANDRGYCVKTGCSKYTDYIIDGFIDGMTNEKQTRTGIDVLKQRLDELSAKAVLEEMAERREK